MGALPPPEDPEWLPLETVPQKATTLFKELKNLNKRVVNDMNFDRMAYLNEALNHRASIEAGQRVPWDPASFVDTYNGSNCVGIAQRLREKWSPKLNIPMAIVPAKIPGKDVYSHVGLVVKTTDGFVLLDVSLNEIAPIILMNSNPVKGKTGVFQWNQDENTITYKRTTDPSSPLDYTYTLMHLNNPSQVLSPQIFKRFSFSIGNFNNSGQISAYISLNFNSRKLKIVQSDFFNHIEKELSIEHFKSLEDVKWFIPERLSTHNLKQDHKVLSLRVWEIIKNWEWLEEELGIGQKKLGLD